MQQLQSIALTSISPEATASLKGYFEDALNFYLYEVIEVPEVINTIYNEGPDRDSLFDRIDAHLKASPNAQVTIFSQSDLSGMKRLEHYDQSKGESEQHELFLRHTISILHSRYKGLTVEAYVPDGAGSFRMIA